MNSWQELFNQEEAKSYYQELMQKIAIDENECNVYPPKALRFNAFLKTPLEKVLVVFVGQDPYHEPGEANGLAFSVNKGIKMPPSLRNLYHELSTDLNIKEPTNPDLSVIAEDGVLFLNCILTVKEHLALSHQGYGWERFTDTVIETLNNQKRPIVFILLGKNAQSLKKLITNDYHFIIEAPHPSPLSCYRGFFGSKIFSKCNAFLNAHYGKTINWQKLNE